MENRFVLEVDSNLSLQELMALIEGSVNCKVQGIGSIDDFEVIGRQRLEILKAKANV